MKIICKRSKILPVSLLVSSAALAAAAIGLWFLPDETLRIVFTALSAAGAAALLVAAVLLISRPSALIVYDPELACLIFKGASNKLRDRAEITVSLADIIKIEITGTGTKEAPKAARPGLIVHTHNGEITLEGATNRAAAAAAAEITGLLTEFNSKQTVQPPRKVRPKGAE